MFGFHPSNSTWYRYNMYITKEIEMIVVKDYEKTKYCLPELARRLDLLRPDFRPSDMISQGYELFWVVSNVGAIGICNLPNKEQLSIEITDKKELKKLVKDIEAERQSDWNPLPQD